MSVALMIISTVDGTTLRAVGCTARVIFMVERRRVAGMRTKFSCEALDLASLHTWDPLESTKRKELAFFPVTARARVSLFSAFEQQALAYHRFEVQV